MCLNCGFFFSLAVVASACCHIPGVTQIYAGVLHVPFTCLLFLSIAVPTCCLMLIYELGFFVVVVLVEGVVSFVPKHSLSFCFINEIRLNLFVPKSFWSEEEGWSYGQ